MPRKTPTGNDRRLKRGDGWVEERTRDGADSKWLARWREPTPAGEGPKRSKVFATKAEAEAHVRSVADTIAQGTYVEPEKLTVERLVLSWIERGVGEWKASTVSTYRQRATSMIVPHLGAILVTNLTPPRVQYWVDTLVKQGTAPNTIDSTARVLSGAFRDAVRLGIVPSNPVTGTRKPTIRQKTIVVWSSEEARRIVETVKDEPMWNAAYRLHLATGMRPGEIQVVRWQDVNLLTATLTVRRTMTKDGDGRPVIGETTKTGRPRAIALAASVVNALQGWRRSQLAIRLEATDWEDGDLIFTTSHGRVLHQSSWQEQLQRAIGEAGVKTITPHGIRHTAATLMLEKGIHPKIVSEILGHQDITTTLNLYSHVSIDLQRTSINEMDRMLYGDVPPSTTGDDHHDDVLRDTELSG